MNLLTNKITPIVAIIFSMTFGATTNVAAAPVLDIEQGVLIGISNINLGANYGEYDVSFNDYSPETQVYGREFSLQANIALLQMFTDPLYFQGHDVDMFGPASTRGCLDSRLCAMVTPTYISGNSIFYDGVYNRYAPYDGIDSMTQQSSLWLPGEPYKTFSTWQPSVPLGAVPIPAALFMFAPALLGFMGFRRRAKNLAA